MQTSESIEISDGQSLEPRTLIERCLSGRGSRHHRAVHDADQPGGGERGPGLLRLWVRDGAARGHPAHPSHGPATHSCSGRGWERHGTIMFCGKQ